jgi:DDE superfamily endonuclease
VPDWHGAAQAARWDGGNNHRSRRRPQKALIEQAYRLGEAAGLQVWCQDEAGPYQAVPQPGASWQPAGDPARRPHEYVRGGTAKLLTLFRPASGRLRAEPVDRAPNTVLHPWLQRELEAILATCAPAPRTPGPGQRWADWLPANTPPWWAEGLPPLRVLLIWDNLQGHHSWEFEQWCLNAGILPLYTPLGGSWLNLAESVQRIVTRRALAGQHPERAEQIQEWFADTVQGWNAAPTPFQWGGKRAARRQRARAKRHALGGSGGYTRRPIRRCHCARALKRYHHDN